MSNDRRPPDPLPGEIDPIGPGRHVSEPEQPPEAWEDEEDIDFDVPDRPSPNPAHPAEIDH